MVVHGILAVDATPDDPTVYTVDEYEPQRFGAVIVQEERVVGLRTDPAGASVIPLDKGNRVDGDPDEVLTGPEIPDSFYGGARSGFGDVTDVPHVAEHLEAIDRERY